MNKMKNTKIDKQIDILSLIPDQSMTGFKFVKEQYADKIQVWYKKPQGGKNVEHIFPRTVNINEAFIECLALSIGDGLNNPCKRNTHCNFSNKNFKLVKQILDWWVSLGYSKNKIAIYAHANTNSDGTKIKKRVDEYFETKKSRVYFSDRNRGPTIMIQIGNAVFQAFYLNLSPKLRKKIINDALLRRAFLRGLFAAEGHVKHSVYGTIESISFAYNPHNEKDLAEYVKECLKKEGIFASNSGNTIYFCDYNRMLKFYLMGGFDLHEDKKNKFVRLCKNAKIHIHVRKELINKLRQFPQKALADALGCNQATISNSIKKGYIKLDYLKRMLSAFNLTKKEVITNIKYIYVRTSKIKDKASIEFLLSLHEFNESQFKIDASQFYQRADIKHFKFLHQLYNLAKTDEITTNTYAQFTNKPTITAQQRLRKLARASILVREKLPRNKFKYNFTEQADALFKDLSKRYILNG